MAHMDVERGIPMSHYESIKKSYHFYLVVSGRQRQNFFQKVAYLCGVTDCFDVCFVFF